MKKSVLKPLLKIKKRMHVFAIKVVEVDPVQKTAKAEINGIEIEFKNLTDTAFLSYWKDSKSAFATLLVEIQRAYDEAD